MINFNPELEIKNNMDNLETRISKPDVFEELDTQFVKDETPSQTVLKRMFLSNGLIDKTDLDEDTIPAITRLLFISDKFKLKSGLKLMQFLFALRISKSRLGRIESFSTVTSENDMRSKGNQPIISFMGGKLPQI